MRQIRVSLSPEVLNDGEEAMASHCAVALLISGRARDQVETVARRIHVAQRGHGAPFVAINAGVFPSHPGKLLRHLTSPIDATAGGSLLVMDVEEMPIRAQDAFVTVLREQLFGRDSTVRLITGTTVSLVDRMAAGHFSECLFYRLNVVHLVI